MDKNDTSITVRLGYETGIARVKRGAKARIGHYVETNALGEALRRIGEGASMIRTNSKLAPSERMQNRGW
jgi:pyridoxal biosynthesis lyase PdxS